MNLKPLGEGKPRDHISTVNQRSRTHSGRTRLSKRKHPVHSANPRSPPWGQAAGWIHVPLTPESACGPPLSLPGFMSPPQETDSPLVRNCPMTVGTSGRRLCPPVGVRNPWGRGRSFHLVSVTCGPCPLMWGKRGCLKRNWVEATKKRMWCA